MTYARAVDLVAAHSQIRPKRVPRSCELKDVRRLARSVWGEALYKQENQFFVRLSQLARTLAKKAENSPRGNDFIRRRFFGAAAFAIVATVKKDGSPMMRKSGEPYVYHMLRSIERLTEDDMPYLGLDAYLAHWEHDIIEDTSITKDFLANVFGNRPAGTVETLSKLKTSRHETKLAQAERYDPRFIRSIQDFVEAIYLKLADLDDYFNTCEKLSEESKLLHFRFLDEVVFPVAFAIVGATRPALAVANKALKVKHNKIYEQHAQTIDQIVVNARGEELEIKAQIEQTLREAGLEAEVKLTYRTPYELYLQQKTEFTLRDIVFYDITVANLQDSYKIRQALRDAFSHLLERVRDFIAMPKHNHYAALHDEYDINNCRARVRITCGEAYQLNNLGLGLILDKSFRSPLLSERAMRLVEGGDRATRTLYLKRLRTLKRVRVVGQHGEQYPERWRRTRFIAQGDNCFDLAAMCEPTWVWQLRHARWRGNSRHGYNALTEPYGWSRGQQITLTLNKHPDYRRDVYSLCQSPWAQRIISKHVYDLSEKRIITIGRRMTVAALRSFPRLDRLGINNPGPDFDQALQGTFAYDPFLLESVAETRAIFSWEYTEEFYHKVALGQIRLQQLLRQIEYGYDALTEAQHSSVSREI